MTFVENGNTFKHWHLYVIALYFWQAPASKEVLKKKQFFMGEAAALDEEAQRKQREEEELKEQRKKEFQDKSSLFNQPNE